MKSTILITLAILCHHCGHCFSTTGRIKVRGKWFVDEQDRVVVLRGINAVNKQAPWIPNVNDNDLTNSSQVNNLREWGFNVVRLGVMWTGVMPVKDVINRTYLNEMLNIVDSLDQHGIYVIIDLHQDMLSSKFMSYDGVPAWLIESMPLSRTNFPWPLKPNALNTSVFAAYITESCGFAFQCLYDNRNKFADYFELYWSTIAQTFANKPNVLAYELLNEPWAGDVYSNPLLLLPGMAGRVNLLPLYDRAYRAIRKFDNETLVFYEPVTWGVMLNHNYLGTGFTRPPGHDRHRTVLAWHHYCWLLQFSLDPLQNGQLSLLDRIVCDGVQLKQSFESIRLDAIALGGGPSFLTEFGVCAFPYHTNSSGGNNTRFNTEECERVLEAADQFMQSWAYWDSNFYDPRSLQTRHEIVRVFSRVYAVAINGEPESFSFDVSSREFLLKFKMNVSNVDEARTPTEIFVPKHVYAQTNGFNVRLTSNLQWIYEPESNRVLIQLIDAIVQHFVNDKQQQLRFEQNMVVSITPNLI